MRGEERKGQLWTCAVKCTWQDELVGKISSSFPNLSSSPRVQILFRRQTFFSPNFLACQSVEWCGSETHSEPFFVSKKCSVPTNRILILHRPLSLYIPSIQMRMLCKSQLSLSLSLSPFFTFFFSTHHLLQQ